MKRLNLIEKLSKEKSKVNEELILLEVKQFLKELSLEDNDIRKDILQKQFDENTYNHLEFDLLDSDKIFHISQIKKICLDYRLRFLDAHLYKGDLPQEAIDIIKRLHQLHDTTLKGFKIMAPSKLFKLKNADDPVLMIPIGNDYYYFIHKWGNDLHLLRKWMVWPVKTFENFIFTMFFVSFFTTFLVPKGIFMDEHSRTEFLLLFLFMFKWLSGIALYYGFAKGKNFNTAIWQSKYYNT